jgi:hypothetical protein
MNELLPWVQGVGFVVGAAWAVSAIRTTTAVLGERIEALARALNRFQETVERVHDDHEERLRKLERNHGR